MHVMKMHIYMQKHQMKCLAVKESQLLTDENHNETRYNVDPLF